VSGALPEIREVAPVVSKARISAAVGDVDAQLLAHMKRWRRGVAEVKGVPAYVILHDASLVEICRRQPRDASELLQITGIGERKAEMYGRQIFDALRGYAG